MVESVLKLTDIQNISDDIALGHFFPVQIQYIVGVEFVQ